MKRAALALVLALGACAATPPPLDGRWKSTGSRDFYSDGSSVEQALACWTEFSGSRSVTECHTGRGPMRMTRANREIAPGQIESEVIEDRNVPRNVGRKSRIDYRVEGNTLVTTAHPAPPANAAARYPVRIEATWVRE
jgi:hypothetical protein